MKNKYNLLKQVIFLFLTLALNGSIFGQYNFNTTIDTYQNLTNPTSLNSNVPWNNASIFPINFAFNFQIGAQTFTSVNVMAGGGLSFPGPRNIQLRVLGHPDSGYLLEDRDQLNSVSKIDYEISGIPGTQILKVQWENAGFREWCASSDTSDYINFQIWLYESINKVEVRFGNYSAAAGAYGQPDCNSGTDGAQFIFEFDNCTNALSLTGNADLPSYNYRDHCFWQPGIHISGTPSLGTVYNLTPTSTNINEITESSIKIYPNPASSHLTIENKGSSINKIHITSLTGTVLETISTNLNEINVDGLPAGIYFIELITKERTITKKFVKQ